MRSMPYIPIMFFFPSVRKRGIAAVLRQRHNLLMHYTCSTKSNTHTHAHTQIYSYLFLSFITHLTLSTSTLLHRSCKLNHTLANSLNITKAKICLPFLFFLFVCFSSQVHLALYIYMYIYIFLRPSVFEFCVSILYCFTSYLSNLLCVLSLPSLAIKYWSISLTGSRYFSLGLPWWLRGKESACQCRRHRFNP